MGNGNRFAGGRTDSRGRAADPVGAFERRAARSPSRAWEPARVCGPVRALPPAAVPVLPIDPSQRPGCPGRAPVDVRRCAVGATARAAQRAAASVAVPDRAQRVDRGDPAARAGCQSGDPGGQPEGDLLRRGGGGGARPLGLARGRSRRAPRACSRGVANAGAQRPLPPGDRDRARDDSRWRQTGDLRSAPSTARAVGGTRDEM